MRSKRHGIILALVASVSLFGAAPAARAQSAAGGDTRAARLAAEKAKKATQLKPYQPNTAEVWVKKLEEQFLTGALHWHPFFTSAYSGGGFTLGAGYAHVRERVQHDRRARQLHAERLQADRDRVPERRACSTAAVCCRSSAAGARRRRSGSTGSARPTRRWTTGPTTASGSRTRRRPWTSGRRGTGWCSAAGSSTRSGSSAPARAARRRSRRSTRRRRCRASARRSPTCTRRARRPSTGAPRAGYSRRGGYYGVTFHDYTDSDDIYGFRQVDYEAIQHVPIFRDAWVLSLHGRVQTTVRRTTAR